MLASARCWACSYLPFRLCLVASPRRYDSLTGLALVPAFTGSPADSFQVGLTVAVALPLVSLWANALGGMFPLLAVRFG